jgi:hypothetical protein
MKNKLFKPTRLMVKRHTITGLRYFCKTTRANYLKYNGSGVRWTAHIKKYGTQQVITEWVSELFYDPDDLKEFALFFSELFNIVESNDWANLKNEDGLEGGMSSQTAKDMWQKPGAKELRSMRQKEAQSRPDIKKKKSEVAKARWNNESYRVKVTDAITKTMNDPKKKKELSDIQKVVQNKPEVLSKRALTMADPIVKEKHRISSKLAQTTPAAKERNKTKMLNLWKDTKFKETRSQAIKDGWNKGRNTREGLNHVKADKRIYEFTHESGLIEKCTRVEMKEKHKIGNISKLISGDIKSSMGWKVKEISNGTNTRRKED